MVLVPTYSGACPSMVPIVRFEIGLPRTEIDSGRNGRDDEQDGFEFSIFPSAWSQKKIGLATALALAVTLPMLLNNNWGNAGAAGVVPTVPASTQFDVTGFLQSASLDQACVTAAGGNSDAQGNPQVAHCGGTMKVNGHTIVVPAETVVILPANALTWQELFDQNPSEIGRAHV